MPGNPVIRNETPRPVVTEADGGVSRPASDDAGGDPGRRPGTGVDIASSPAPAGMSVENRPGTSSSTVQLSVSPFGEGGEKPIIQTGSPSVMQPHFPTTAKD